MGWTGIDKAGNELLDTVIKERRTVRSFTADVPGREDIEKVMLAGLQAPYAAAAVEGVPLFRRFFVMERGGKAMAAAAELAAAGLKVGLEMMKARSQTDPAFAEKAGGFIKRLEMASAAGVMPLAEAPYYIVVAEKKGIPPAEKESLAHCLENMWLKATALGLGFRLISMTAQLGEDPRFCELLGLPPGEFAVDGCTIGYATEWPAPTARPAPEEAIEWLS